MIHVGALPGTPRHRLPMREIVAEACREARLYLESGVQALMIENMHDVPYLRGGVGPEIVAGMACVAQAVRAEVAFPLGLQILAAADREALAVAHAASFDFIRVECFSFAHIADEGLMQSNAAELLRYRRAIGAGTIQIWADIKKKHASHALTSDLGLSDVAAAAEFMGADAIIVTGTATGKPPLASDVAIAGQGCGLPVYVGSGVNPGNAAGFLQAASGLIVGSDCKRGGRWSNSVDPERVKRLLDAIA